MSVSQVKKRFAEMESYLGRDKEALRRLKLLKDDVNVLRTSLAAAEEKAAKAESVKDAARERADKAEAALEEVKIELHRLSQQVATITHDLDVATKPDDDEKDDEDVATGVEPDVFSKGMKDTLKALRKSRDLPRCPMPIGRFVSNTGLSASIFRREDIALGWSRRSLYLTGAVVAIMAEYQGEVRIVASPASLEDGRGNIADWTLNKHFLKWIERHIDWTSRSELDRHDSPIESCFIQ
jgi:hypothetical protein